MQSLVLFLAFLMELTEDEHYVCCASVGSEATLALGEVFFGDGWCELVEQDHDPGEYFATDGQWDDSSVIGAVRRFTLVLVLDYEDGIVRILWQLIMLSAAAAGQSIVKLDMERWTTMIPDFRWDAVNAYCFATLKTNCAFSRLFKGRVKVRHGQG